QKNKEKKYVENKVKKFYCIYIFISLDFQDIFLNNHNFYHKRLSFLSDSYAYLIKTKEIHFLRV
ncbi:TPA: hypothetical protein ACQXHP_000745, partial [Streptococcus pneumoniae]